MYIFSLVYAELVYTCWVFFFFLKVEVEKKKRKEMHVVYETNIHE
jgi:hypothetical protein